MNFQQPVAWVTWILSTQLKQSFQLPVVEPTQIGNLGVRHKLARQADANRRLKTQYVDRAVNTGNLSSKALSYRMREQRSAIQGQKQPLNFFVQGAIIPPVRAISGNENLMAESAAQGMTIVTDHDIGSFPRSLLVHVVWLA